MRIKKGLELRRVANENVVVSISGNSIELKVLISMNDSASYLWRECERLRDFDAPKLASLLVARYDVDFDRALVDSHIVIAAWHKAGVIG